MSEEKKDTAKKLTPEEVLEQEMNQARGQGLTTKTGAKMAIEAIYKYLVATG